MSVLDEYNRLKKKRLGLTDDEDKSNGGSSVTSVLSEYNRLKAERLAREGKEEDIAPVISPSTSTKEEEEEDESGWFKSGAFDDGYQFGDGISSVLSTVGDVGVNALKGAGGLVEGVTDLILYGVSGVSDLVGADSFADDVKRLAQQQSVNDALSGVEEFFDKNSFLGDRSDAVSQGIGQVAGIIATGGLGASAGLSAAATTALTTGLMGASSFGSGMGEAYQSGASDEEALAYGAMKGIVDAGTELIFGGLGKTVKALGLSKGISSLDDVFAKKLSSKISNQFWSNAAEFGVKASAEGVEEVLAGYGSAVAKHLTYMSEEDLGKLVEDENLLDQFVVGALTSGITQSGIVPGMKGGSLLEANKTGRDFITGLSTNEEKVVDKIYKDRIAEESEKGDVSKKRKSEIYDEVLNEMEKGYFSTDTIDEMFGGDAYKAYKDNIAKEEALRKEYNELYNMKNGDKSSAQVDREAELKKMMEDIDKGTTRAELQSKLRDTVFGTIKGSRLVNSYIDSENRLKRYADDATKQTNKYAKATIENAIKSGVVNNSNRAHEMTETLSKISSDQNVVYDYVNDKIIAEQGRQKQRKVTKTFTADGQTAEFSLNTKRMNSSVKPVVKVGNTVVENYTVDYETGNIVFDSAPKKGKITVDYSAFDRINGWIETLEDGTKKITLNMDSNEVWQFTTGHEITHKLEGTKKYSKFREVLYQYAKDKGDYDGLMESVKKRYEEGTDYDSELTADLVGRYLFQDEDFVKHLSVNHRNVFQWLWDEVKHLSKLVTAGSKEARQLEKVKHAFEEAYRAGGKAQTGTQYSIAEPFTDSNGTRFENAVLLDTDFFDGTSPRNWGAKLRNMLNKRASESPFIMPIVDENGNATMLQFANPKDRVRKNGGSDHIVLNELSSTSDNISKLAVIHIDEIVSVSDENSPYHTIENEHQWLDKNGWLHRNANVINRMNGNIYNLTIDIAKAADGRTILYATDGKIKKVGNVNVNSLKIKGSRQNSNSADIVPQTESKVNKQFYDSETKYSVSVTDEDTLDFLDNQETITTYKTMQLVDGKLYPPMDARTEGKYEDASVLGKWEQATEHPELIKDGNKFKLDKGKGQGSIEAAYNPYMHSSNLVLNDQFSGAYARTNLVTVECEVPVSELTSGYHAQYAKDSVGWHAWHTGTVAGNLRKSKGIERQVFLSRWIKPVRIVPDSEVAAMYKELLDGTDVEVPDNVVTPALLSELKKAGVKIKESGRVKYSISDSDGNQLTEEQQEYFKDSKVRDENGNLKVMYHGTPNGDFTVFKDGTYFTENKWYADLYQNPGASSLNSRKVATNPKTFEVYLDIKKPFDINDEEARSIYINDYVKGGNAVGINPYLSDAEYAKIDSIDWTEGEDLREFLIDNEYDYDGLVLDEGATGGYGDDVNYRGKSYVVFSPEQVKNVDNLNPTENPDIRFSVSEWDDQPTKYGNFATPMSEVRYEAPTQEEVAPVQEVAEETTTPAPVAPVQTDIAPTPMQGVDVEETAPTFDATPKKGVAEGQQALWEEPAAEEKLTRKALHERIIESVKSVFKADGFDFDQVLKKAKNLSTFATVDNTPQRVMEKALGYKEGQILSDLTVNKVAQNETEGIKWLSSFTDRKNGVLAQMSKQYGIKPGSKESAAAQMYAEGFYVDENNNIIQYGDAELAADFKDANVRNNIKKLARDPRIRQIYDETLDAINESRKRNAYPEIPRLENYYLHFRAMEDTFSRLGLPFNPNDIRAKDLPTDLNGVTADLKPGQPYFASAMHRTGKRTSFDLLGGMERYLSSAKNQIYHIDDIQTLRALRNYIADTFGQANGLSNIDSMTEEEAQERIKEVYGSHLSTFAKFLNEEANVLAGKTALIDRGLEGIIGRRGITFLDTINKQVGSNMVGFNVSSSLTNFLPVVQTFAKSNKAAFVKAFAQTVSNKVNSIYGKSDGFAENSSVIIRRKGADRFYRTPYQKIGDVGYVFMSAVDDISTELIARTKYNEFIKNGMSEQQAHYETDKWVSRLMGDRSLGQMPQLYNSKMLGLVTKFQLEVRNQLDSQFYDTIQEAKEANENIQDKSARNAKTAAKVASTFFQLAVAQHLFGMAFESVAGYNPAFDIIDAIIKTFGWDDEEDSEDTALDNIEQGFLTLLEDMPYASTFMDGGRIPISSALPIGELIKGEDQYGMEKSRWETLGEIAPYYVLPGGYGQLKKSTQGLAMFDDDLPTSGSYTDSGNLRFPVEDTFGNRLQAGIFGQWANENARDYFDNERSPLNEKQTQEYIDLEMPIRDYWEYREGLKKQETLEDKFDYIAGLDVSVQQKNIMINNVVDRAEEVDMSNYDDFGSFEEFDFYTKNTEKYNFLQENNVSYSEYMESDDSREKYDSIYSWVNNYPDKVTVSKAVTDNVIEYRGYISALYDIKADKDENGKSITGSRKDKVIDYVNNLDIDYGARLILFKSEYPSDDTYNYDIINYLEENDAISGEEMRTILTELGFHVSDDGTISWD